MATQTTVMQTQTPTPKEEWLIQKIVLGLTPARLFLAAIIILAAFLNFYQLGNIGDGNLYYTAAVKSMLQSWHNFFFVAAEPGAAVTVDKPPLGLWVEAASAFVFGVNGFAVVLPNILAGLIAIPVLYHLTKKYFGPAAGLVAALVVAITPVAVAAQRNNTMDGMLTLVLLLAAWAFLKATETGRLRHLLLGALLVGLGFNIKMLQAFLPLPAFYAVYFLGAKVGWGRKLVHLGVATLLLLVVSLAWAVAVDLTPVAERPYVGSSTDNTVMELIIGHNGLNRWFGGEGPSTQQGAFDAGQRPLPNADDSQMPPPALNGRPTPPNGAPPNGAPADGPRTPPNDGQQRPPLAGGGPGGSNEVGVAGVLRFWQAPLSKEMSWLLPLALVGGLLVLLGHKLTLPLAPRHQFLLIWGGWLAVGLIFFSFAGFFHAYYLVMLAPPLAALVGAGVAELLALRQKRWNVATAVLLITAALTLAFQWFNAAQFVESVGWLPLMALLAGLGTAVWLVRGRQAAWAHVGLTLLLAAMFLTPLVWTYLTTTEVDNVNLPGAYEGQSVTALPGADDSRTADTRLLAYLQANTQDSTYLMAVPSSMQGAEYVVATGRPVLYMGGFNGSDPVVDAAGLGQMVAEGDLRYILLRNAGRDRNANQEIEAWVTQNCTAVSQFNGLYVCAAP